MFIRLPLAQAAENPQGQRAPGDQHQQELELMRIADDFRTWVIGDLQSLPAAERDSFRGDYLFVIDGSPLFLVVVASDAVSSARWKSAGGSVGIQDIQSDVGAPCSLSAEAISSILDGQCRVSVHTDSNTLRRLLQGTLRAKVAYLSGLVKINGDLPCFMRLVGVLKRRGVGPVQQSGVPAT
ncbi:MAG: hypothetical protein RI953_2587 [Pseudomonadota bacterium]|jgi:hypothetical protein